ncbi:hypothetical protein EON63_05585 [archaeon]|nr:MAG: hypothetical protein EON63_05585 [archaeon]
MHRLLKVFSASEYLDYFASDRSHMLNSQMPFPPWPVIRGSKATISMNLMQFVDMSTRDGGVDSVPGLVMTIRDFLKWTRSR